MLLSDSPYSLKLATLSEMSGLSEFEVTERFQEFALFAEGKPSRVREDSKEGGKWCMHIPVSKLFFKFGKKSECM